VGRAEDQRPPHQRETPRAGRLSCEPLRSVCRAPTLALPTRAAQQPTPPEPARFYAELNQPQQRTDSVSTVRLGLTPRPDRQHLQPRAAGGIALLTPEPAVPGRTSVKADSTHVPARGWEYLPELSSHPSAVPCRWTVFAAATQETLLATVALHSYRNPFVHVSCQTPRAGLFSVNTSITRCCGAGPLSYLPC
jgi:hypothetical protein